MVPFFRRSLWVILFGFVAALRADDHRLVAIMGAYPPELAALRAEFGVEDNNKGFTTSYVNGVRFDRGTIDGKDVIIFQAGSSIVNATLQLQMALDHFPITTVLFAGVAGGTDPQFAMGDVVIPEKWAYHSEAIYLNDDGQGGYVPSPQIRATKTNYGMIFPHNVSVVREGQDRYQPMESFPADEALLALARRVVPKIPEIKKGVRPITVNVGGTGVSGPVFLDNASYRQWLFATWHAVCVDMESTAYAHVCWVNHKPVLIIRGLSDLAGAQQGKNPIRENTLSVSAIAVKVLHEVLKEM